MFLADHTLQHSLFNYHQTPIMEGLTLTWEWVKKKQLPMLKVSTNDRIRGGLNQTVAGATQVINPVGINLFTGNNTGMTGTTQATPRKP